jgi:hypothetical protein
MKMDDLLGPQDAIEFPTDRGPPGPNVWATDRLIIWINADARGRVVAKGCVYVRRLDER